MTNAVSKAVKKVRNARKPAHSRNTPLEECQDARRRLENRLEEMKLKKELREFDFDFN